MASFWSDACKNAIRRPLQTQLDTAYGSCSVTVSAFVLLLHGHAWSLIHSAVTGQIVAYCASAGASGIMLFLWLRMNQELRLREWRLYGWFSGLMLCGSCVGAVTWAAWMQVLINLLIGTNDSTISASQRNFHFAAARSWRVVFSVTYALEFLCLTVALLSVLDRMFKFAAPSGEAFRRWVLAARTVMALVVVVNVVGLAGNIAGAVAFARAAESYLIASESYAANNTAAGDINFVLANDDVQRANFIVSVQSLCEVAVLLLIVAAFTIVALACARRINTASSTLIDAAASREQVSALARGKMLRRQIVCTTAFVFVTFLLRSVYSTMYAVAYQQQDFAKPCSGRDNLCDANCYNVYTHIVGWMVLTPGACFSLFLFIITYIRSLHILLLRFLHILLLSHALHPVRRVSAHRGAHLPAPRTPRRLVGNDLAAFEKQHAVPFTGRCVLAKTLLALVLEFAYALPFLAFAMIVLTMAP
jgi:hypothetical protein